MDNGNKVWFAAYGTDMARDRFMEYINGDGIVARMGMSGCQDKTPPSDERPYEFKHPIYFAHESEVFEGSGTAFLDNRRKGRSLGKAYLIAEDQFKEIYGQWNDDLYGYNKIVPLGIEEGTPILTLTQAMKQAEGNPPSEAYLVLMRSGLHEAYPDMTDADISAYLEEAKLN